MSEISDRVSYSHLQLYVDKVDDVAAYKALEEKLNKFAAASKDLPDLAAKQKLWADENGGPPEPFEGPNRDVVKQLMTAFGFRVTASRITGTDTRSVLVTSRDAEGLQLVVTAKDPDNASNKDPLPFFQADNVTRYVDKHHGNQGIAVLAFHAEDVDKIHGRYKEKHPNLISECGEYEGVKILEVFAYYDKEEGQADKGTMIRFIQPPDSTKKTCPLPGLTPVDAKFDDSSYPAYCDHWVSNVHNRLIFMDTLNDTLGFTPKVDFNAGVVAAGEAQIESTVIGNDAPSLLLEAALKDQNQVYLPTNNALSADGHVHFFLQEQGQGIQHAASRVEDIVSFVQGANDMRKISGEGFSFLNIPRSYYGILNVASLTEGDGGVSEGCASAILEALDAGNVLSKDGALDLDIGADEVALLLEKGLTGDNLDAYTKGKDAINKVILGSRYKNMFSLLGSHLSEETYMGIVRNQILVDVQGEDLLYQIFTSKILHRDPAAEAPFFEFIQRVCSEAKDENGNPLPIRPGCGGFGIRNFLTLFLSIEVSKSMQEVADAKEAGNAVRQKFAQQMVDGFTNQLSESNPILTGISDAMTEEGRCREKMLEAKDDKEKEEWKTKMEAAAKKKLDGNEALKVCSARYNELMKNIREERNKLERGEPLRASLTLPVGA